MTTVVPLLERLACSPYADEAYAAAVAGLAPPLRDALLGGNATDLARIVGLQPVMACMVFSPDENEPRPEDAPAEDAPADPDPTGPSES